jgi:hypothetical protein
VTEKPSLNDRILSRRTSPPTEDDPDSCDDCGAFGYLRGVRDRALMLDLKLKNGNREAFSYTLLERIQFDPSEGITLQYTGVSVKLRGRNLERLQTHGVALLEGLQRHRVPWIVESDELRSAAASDAVAVTEILIPPVP